LYEACLLALRFISREIVDAVRSKLAAIFLIDCPVARNLAISQRSSKDS
jgi:hypothetical protein